MSMTCTRCGKTFESGDTNGLPNGAAFVLQDGKQITLCQECIMDVGKMVAEDKKDKN